jgi:hypothetical protein
MRTAAWARALLRRLFNMLFALGYLAYVHTPLGAILHAQVGGLSSVFAAPLYQLGTLACCFGLTRDLVVSC